jgi:hypothetical protein
MKTRTFVSILILVLAVLIFVGNEAFAEEIDVYKKLSGTWINKEYDGISEYHMGKYVIKPDGTFDAYADTSDISRLYFGEIISIDEKWIDSEGNFWYKFTSVSHVTHRQRYELGKIHSSGNVWELISLSYDYPNELDPNHGKYRIYYRQE